MVDRTKVIARHQSTPPTGPLSTGSRSGRLPEEILVEQVDRLSLFAAVGAGLWAFGLSLDSTLVPFLNLGTNLRAAVAIETTFILICVAMFCYTRWAPDSPGRKTTVGLVFMVANAVGVAMLNTVANPPIHTFGIDVSWNTILILVFSMISPAPPRQMLAASLVAASMDPLAVWIAHLRGVQVSSPLVALVHFLPNYVCAVVATVPSHAMHRMGRRLREAQDLGSYRLKELLGHGGMGEVWRAEHRLLVRGAAVKLVRPELLGAANEAESTNMLRRFELEAKATAALSSPHSIQIFDYGHTDDGTFYYVMELLSGRDLESLVRDFGPMPADRTVFLLRQVCHSLADAHARGLVHRDIKPANIYVCRMGLDYDFVKVLDFGLVKVRERGNAQQTLMTVEHRTTGTPAYMAPELILGESEVDRRADVYALGCVAYFLLTGQLVFEADSPMKMLMHHLNTEPAPPSQRTEMPIPPELDELILSCLQKDPRRRPQHAEDLLKLAYGCRSCEKWDSEAARKWWAAHLPDLTGPLTLRQDRPADVPPAAAVR
jgi:eukaryotic-like serine/threonine-protein kinase